MLPRPYLVLSFGVIHFIKKLILYRGFSPQKMKGYRTLYSACCTHQVLSVSIAMLPQMSDSLLYY